MLALEFHPLVEADLTEAAEWYERQQTGVGVRFAAEAHEALHNLTGEALLYTVRFDDIRRMNLPTIRPGFRKRCWSGSTGREQRGALMHFIAGGVARAD